MSTTADDINASMASILSQQYKIPVDKEGVKKQLKNQFIKFNRITNPNSTMISFKKQSQGRKKYYSNHKKFS